MFVKHREVCFCSFLLVLCIPIAAQISVKGDKNQTSGTNNGVMNQYNITVKPEVKKTLERAAREDFGQSGGWLPLLTPANDPPMKTSCLEIPPEAMVVVLGGGNVGACTTQNCGILADASADVNTRDLLSVTRKGRSLEIKAVVFDEVGRVIAKLNNNKPHINNVNAFEWNRPDPNTLDVIDQRNRTVLHIRFVNPKTVYVEGLFYNSIGDSATIRKDEILVRRARQQVGGNHARANCSINAGVSAFAF